MSESNAKNGGKYAVDKNDMTRRLFQDGPQPTTHNPQPTTHMVENTDKLFRAAWAAGPEDVVSALIKSKLFHQASADRLLILKWMQRDGMLLTVGDNDETKMKRWTERIAKLHFIDSEEKFLLQNESPCMFIAHAKRISRDNFQTMLNQGADDLGQSIPKHDMWSEWLLTHREDDHDTPAWGRRLDYIFMHAIDAYSPELIDDCDDLRFADGSDDLAAIGDHRWVLCTFRVVHSDDNRNERQNINPEVIGCMQEDEIAQLVSDPIRRKTNLTLTRSR